MKRLWGRSQKMATKTISKRCLKGKMYTIMCEYEYTNIYINKLMSKL